MLGIIAWGAVAFIVIVGVARGEKFSDVLLLGTAMAISAIPTGMPAFVSGLLSMGAKQLADSKAVVKNLTDVETLGATSAINTDKTGTLTLNQMMVSTMYTGDAWFTVEGEGYRKTGALTSVAGAPVPDFTRIALGLVLDSDATVGDDGSVVGDPTEAALVVLAAKLGVDAEETRRAYPRIAEVPFDSDYKFMATFHRYSVDGTERVIQLVKGGPDVVLARCTHSGGPMSGSQVPVEEARAGIDAANERMGEKGLRVLAFAARLVDDGELEAMAADPMSLTRDLAFVGMVGIIDPLRPSSRVAVQTALGAGIDVRMITGDHAVTAQAIGETLGLGPGAISGSELQALSDDEVKRRLPELHVFGRVSPQDKLRLARLMQEQGLIVAMTGDAVNDAAALKQADIGVAMGSGSEVTKQAGRMILTDDNFGTLVNAVEIGRRVYEKVVSYVRYQMTQLLSLVFLFIAATAFDINQGVALTPLMVLYLLVFMTASGVVVIAVDPGAPDVMHRPPRDPKVPITNRAAVTLWVVYGLTLFVAALIPLVAGPDDPKTDVPTASLTMTFVVMGLGTVFNALTNRRDPASGLSSPLLKALGDLAVPAGDDRARNGAARPPEGAAHHLADRQGVARLLRPRRAAAAGRRDEQVDPPPSRAGIGPGRRAPRARPRPSRYGGNAVSKKTKSKHETVEAPAGSRREDGPQGVRAGDAAAARRARRACRSGSRRRARRSASSSRGATPQARAARSSGSPSGSARACSASSPCPHPPSARSRRCTSSATSGTSPPRARS